MISESIINTILKSPYAVNKDNVIKELIKHFYITYDYNDNCKSHILEMLVDEKAIITKDNVDVCYVEENINKFIYNSEKYNIKDITVKEIDNIDCVIRFNYKYIEKINEDRNDITYTDDVVSISYIDFPQVLKKS